MIGYRIIENKLSFPSILYMLFITLVLFKVIESHSLESVVCVFVFFNLAIYQTPYLYFQDYIQSYIISNLFCHKFGETFNQKASVFHNYLCISSLFFPLVILYQFSGTSNYHLFYRPTWYYLLLSVLNCSMVIFNICT